LYSRAENFVPASTKKCRMVAKRLVLFWCYSVEAVRIGTVAIGVLFAGLQAAD
jgi:hypothetical protein